MKFRLGEAIIHGDVETSRERNEHLMEDFVSMTRAVGATRDVVQVVDSLYLERNMFAPFDKGKVPAWIRDFWKFD